MPVPTADAHAAFSRAAPVSCSVEDSGRKKWLHSVGSNRCMLWPRQLPFGSGPNRVAITSLRTGWQDTRSVGDLYMTADACTHIPASMAEGWVYTHTACSTWPCRSLWPSSLFCRELRPRMADLSWQLTDLARSGLAVTQACHRRGPELSRSCPVDHPILWAVYLRSLPVCVCKESKACVDYRPPNPQQLTRWPW